MSDTPKKVGRPRGRRTHCPRGHDLMDPANQKPNNDGYYRCRACANLVYRQIRKRLRDAKRDVS